MPTGACGINCSVCRLHRLGVCSSCGSGTSDAGRDKLAAQRRLLGGACPILECATLRGVGFCMLDCNDFPCAIITSSEYPFGSRFCSMQERRRKESGNLRRAAWPEAAEFFWSQLATRPLMELCAQGSAIRVDEHRVLLQSLNETWEIDRTARKVRKIQGEFGGEWDRQIPFLIVVYLATVNVETIAGEMTTAVELYRGLDPFLGHTSLKTGDFESYFGRERTRFETAANLLGGMVTKKADISARFMLFPKFPVELLLWLADEEFPAKLTVLFDRTFPTYYPADGAGTAVNLLLQRLLMVAEAP